MNQASKTRSPQSDMPMLKESYGAATERGLSAKGKAMGWISWARWPRGRLLLSCMIGIWLTSACSLDGLLKSNELPPDVTDPAITQTPAGAQAAYNGALQGLAGVFGFGFKSSSTPFDNLPSTESFITTTGLLSDELTDNSGSIFSPNPVDLRRLQEGPDQTGLGSIDLLSQNLNNLRQRARQARGLLNDYVPKDLALQAHLYAVEGYAEVMLAEVFCSGIPLSTVDYKGDYTLRPGSSTGEAFTHAAALFDTTLALAGDSARILNLGRVGRARALLGRGDYVAAAIAAAEVPDTFRYAVRYTATDGIGYVGRFSIWNPNSVSDREGTNGLPYRTSGDPRTSVTLLSNGRYHPNKYTTSGADTVVLASGVEARLIEAEAALKADPNGGQWLVTLNHLRQTAITPALPDTTDPGSDTARVSLLFRERAFWLFLTGHRQGDMRRLVRQYRRPQSQVYPVGTNVYGGVYGSFVDAPIPWDERTLNPLFTGCLSRD